MLPPGTMATTLRCTASAETVIDQSDDRATIDARVYYGRIGSVPRTHVLAGTVAVRYGHRPPLAP
jgi:hypothetical protein